MPKLNVGINLNDVDTDFPVADPGMYPCTITKVESGESQSGKAKLVFTFRPTVPVPCQVGKTVKEVTGRDLFRQHVSLDPQALYALKDLLVAAKVAFNGGEFDYEDFLGKEVRVKVSKEPAKNDPDVLVNNVKKVLPIG